MLTRNYCCYCCCYCCSCYWHTQMVLMISDSLCTYYSWCCCCCCHWQDYWQSSWVVDVPKMLTCPRTSGCSATNCFLPATIEKCQIFSSLITITKTKFHGQKSDDAQIFLPLDIFRVSNYWSVSPCYLPAALRGGQKEIWMSTAGCWLPGQPKSESEWKMFLIGLSVMHIELWAAISSDSGEGLASQEMKV